MAVWQRTVAGRVRVSRDDGNGPRRTPISRRRYRNPSDATQTGSTRDGNQGTRRWGGRGVFGQQYTRVRSGKHAFQFSARLPGLRKFKSYSYRFETPEGSVVFTGDTGPSASVTKLAMHATVLVSEVITANDYLSTMQAMAKTPITEEQQKRNVMHMSEVHLLPEEVGKNSRPQPV